MHDDRKLVEDRITRYLHHVLSPALLTARAALTVSAWHLPGAPVPVAEALAVPGAHCRPFAIGETWGGPWFTTWFRFSGQIPADPERSSAPSQLHDGALDLTLRPFQILTLRLTAGTSNA